MERTPGRATWLLLISSALFVLLTVLVLQGATQSIDSAVFHRLRPGDGWGESQIRYSPWMNRLRPSRMYLLLGLTSVLASVCRRSPWPLAFASVLAGVSGAATLAVKLAAHRPDPHGHMADSGGAYPSGHTVAVLVCLGGCLLVLWPAVRWWLWTAVVVAGCLMTSALLVSGAHWLTDVTGGGILAIAVLSAGSRLRLRASASRQRRARGG